MTKKEYEKKLLKRILEINSSYRVINARRGELLKELDEAVAARLERKEEKRK